MDQHTDKDGDNHQAQCRKEDSHDTLGIDVSRLASYVENGRARRSGQDDQAVDDSLV
jgi:hypothetical protein